MAGAAWSVIHAERGALAGDLAKLTDVQWATPSLCPGWSVRDVLVHLTVTAKSTPLSFLGRFVASGFRFHSMSEQNIRRERKATPAEDLAEFKRVQNRTSSPPGPPDTWLGEVIVHSEDIRRPLGIAHRYPDEALTRVATFYTRSNLLIGGKSRVADVHLRATDVGWSAGSGPEIAGPLLSLVLLITGRPAPADLSGDGLASLARQEG
jgi:uncharacterized protein (TIGR03083 family)